MGIGGILMVYRAGLWEKKTVTRRFCGGNGYFGLREVGTRTSSVRRAVYARKFTLAEVRGFLGLAFWLLRNRALVAKTYGVPSFGSRLGCKDVWSAILRVTDLDLVSTSGGTDLRAVGDVEKGPSKKDFERGLVYDLDLQIDRDRA
jgi:hypothetical protein